MLMGLRVVQLGFRDIISSLVIEVELILGSYLIFCGLYMSTSNSRPHAIFCFDGKIKMSSSFLNFCVHFFLLFFFNFSHMDTPPLSYFTFYLWSSLICWRASIVGASSDMLRSNKKNASSMLRWIQIWNLCVSCSQWEENTTIERIRSQSVVISYLEPFSVRRLLVTAVTTTLNYFHVFF